MVVTPSIDAHPGCLCLLLLSRLPRRHELSVRELDLLAARTQIAVMRFSPAVLLGIFLSITSLSLARLGETLDQCVERYGPVVEKKSATLSESDPEACIFSKNGVTIAAEFRGGIVWRLAFRIASMIGEETETLLRANMPEGGSWSSSLTVNGLIYRLSSDRRRVAVLTPAPTKDGLASLEIVSKDYAASKRAAFLARTSDLQGIAKQRTTTGKTLEGF